LSHTLSPVRRINVRESHFLEPHPEFGILHFHRRLDTASPDSKFNRRSQLQNSDVRSAWGWQLLVIVALTTRASVSNERSIALLRVNAHERRFGSDDRCHPILRLDGRIRPIWALLLRWPLQTLRAASFGSPAGGGSISTASVGSRDFRAILSVHDRLLI